ncbi:MAG: glucosyl-3-phosphoglycerate synthase [Actinomycetes bacterium]
MDAAAREMLRERTSRSCDWVLADLLRAKSERNLRVSVILPAHNEEATVGSIVEAIRDSFVDTPGPRLVDELLVLDSGSTDRTAEVAAHSGARVTHRDEVLPRIPTVSGKGEAMWRALAATSSDLVVFVDADLRSFNPSYITGLLGPLLVDPNIHLVKAVYERPLHHDGGVSAAGGGRVTELVARPLLNLYWPSLAGVIQPLAGEYAARRTLLEQLPFPCGYGVEFALLVDTAETVGVGGIAQVDLGVRLHRHHSDLRLGRMSAEILQTAWSRLDSAGHLRRDAGIGTTLSQFEQTGAATAAGYTVTTHDVAGLERPPLRSVPEYRASRTKRLLPGHSQPT